MSYFNGPQSGPRIVDCYIGSLPGGSGTVWSSGFLGYLGSNYGYQIPVGRNVGVGLSIFDISGRGQLNPLPWINLNCFTLIFNEDVNVSSNSLVITAVSGSYPITSFSYAATGNNYAASWYFNQSSRPAADRIHRDKIRITLPSSGVTSKSSNLPLAGSIVNATWTESGDASTTAGKSLPSRGANSTNFSLRLNIVPGDVGGDTYVASDDGTYLRLRRELTVSSGNYSAFVDVNGDGIIRSGIDTSGVPPSEDDVLFLQIGTSLPTGVI